MDLRQFTAEAERLAKKGNLLSLTGQGEPAGYWHGIDTNAICISVAYRSGWLNLYPNHDNSGLVELSAQPRKSAKPLFAIEYISLPPIDAVFMFGSKDIEGFLERNGWERSDPFNDNFPSPIPGEYERIWQSSNPMYARGVAAVCGGWHFPWPEGDWHDLSRSELVLWTIQDAEPWIEVFFNEGKFSVKQRAT